MGEKKNYELSDEAWLNFSQTQSLRLKKQKATFVFFCINNKVFFNLKEALENKIINHSAKKKLQQSFI